MAEISPGRLLKGKSPRLLDAWQIAPKVWDAVRFEGDQMFAVLIKMAGREFPEICLQNDERRRGRADTLKVFSRSIPAV